MARRSPSLIVLAGPNGAGKSTAAPALLQGVLGVTEFVNADVISSGLSGFAPDRAAMAAGRIMLERMKELARQRRDFAFETLASRSFAPWIAELVRSGYRFHLVFLWLRKRCCATRSWVIRSWDGEVGGWFVLRRGTFGFGRRGGRKMAGVGGGR